MTLLVSLVLLISTLPPWAQAIAYPAAERVEYVDSLPVGYGYTTADKRILLALVCRANDEILAQCLVHEGRHLQGHGECLAYTAQLLLAVKQSDDSWWFAYNLYEQFGKPVCLLD